MTRATLLFVSGTVIAFTIVTEIDEIVVLHSLLLLLLILLLSGPFVKDRSAGRKLRMRRKWSLLLLLLREDRKPFLWSLLRRNC